MTLNLGPVSLPLTNGSILSNGKGFAHNPRCLKRDLTDAINRKFANATSVVRNILLPNNIWDFQMTMQGTPGTGDIGIHGGGHYAIGGDPARDVSSPRFEETTLVLRIIVLYITRRPGLLPAPFDDRSCVVDLAEFAPQDRLRCPRHLWHWHLS